MKLYPVNIDVKVHITNGVADGAATFGMWLHKLPTEQDMPDILAKVMQALPEGFRLMSRHESMMYFLREQKGYRGPNLALPDLEAGEEWHDPETAHTYSSLGDDEDFEGDEE